MSYNDNNIVVDVSCTKFCVGPCNSKEKETTKNKFLKPYSGGKYNKFCYPINEDSYLILKNVRICSSCNQRYMEFYDENEIESLKQDAKTIRKKLGI
ncbi:hypothetical protein OAH43_00425 [bacterium]|nr:hypothetical protein [bacterium]|tara:strand:- start:10099 stop:10389 length:291 start_codon:yes stop_codon:yes gene_type:complete